jgi:hypothetical protein
MTYCLEIFEEVLQKIPSDRDLILKRAVCAQGYDFVDGELKDFIHYQQGLLDWENGFFDWGNDHFNRITPNSYYYYKYMYQKALYRIYENDIDGAIAILEEITGSPYTDKKFMNDVNKTLARLLYEKGEYDKADHLYTQIEDSILGQSMNLMERAWVHYRLGNPEKAMGLLYAFRAPVYRAHFTPEYYILKSFIYKDVCHYQSAMNVVSGFRDRYGESIKSIYDRDEMMENDALLLLILNKREVNKTWKYIQLLEEERKKIQEFGNTELSIFLQKIYDLQMNKSRNVLKKQMKREFEKYADEMLKYEEESHLMAYEIGLDMYQRIQKYHYTEETGSNEKEPESIVVYPFQDEFWSDELADYKVVLPDKCKDMEEWDIFFK